MEIDYIEFGDPADPRSTASAKHDGGIRFTLGPRAFAALLPNGKMLTGDDQDMLARLLEMAYAQGKRVGALSSGISGEDAK